MHFALLFLAITATIAALSGAADPDGEQLPKPGGKRPLNNDAYETRSPKLSDSPATRVVEGDACEKPPADLAGPTGAPPFVPVAASLLERLKSDGLCPKLQGLEEQLYTHLESFVEFCKVLARTAFEGLIFGPLNPQEEKNAQTEILELAKILNDEFGIYKYSSGRGWGLYTAMKKYFSVDMAKYYMSGMVDDFGWMEDIFKGLGEQAQLKLFNLISSLSVSYFVASARLSNTSAPESSRAITVELIQLLAELCLDPKDEIEILKLTRRATSLPGHPMVLLNNPGSTEEEYTPEQLLAVRALESLKALFPKGPNRSSLYVDRTMVKISRDLTLASCTFWSDYPTVYSAWERLPEYFNRLRRDLPRVVDTVVGFLEFYTQVIEKLSPSFCEGYIPDTLFYHGVWEVLGNWLQKVRTHCQAQPDDQGCSELPKMITFYREQRARLIRACEEASKLSKSFVYQGEDVMRLAIGFFPDIITLEEGDRPQEERQVRPQVKSARNRE